MSNETNNGCPQGYTTKPQVEGIIYTAVMPNNGSHWCYGPKGERVESNNTNLNNFINVKK
jgi:hypothetical protein